MLQVTESQNCGGCFDRVGLVCVVHLCSVRYTTVACEVFRPAPKRFAEPKTVTATEMARRRNDGNSLR
jgi:hypothetical protein